MPATGLLGPIFELVFLVLGAVETAFLNEARERAGEVRDLDGDTNLGFTGVHDFRDGAARFEISLLDKGIERTGGAHLAAGLALPGRLGDGSYSSSSDFVFARAWRPSLATGSFGHSGCGAGSGEEHFNQLRLHEFAFELVQYSGEFG